MTVMANSLSPADPTTKPVRVPEVRRIDFSFPDDIPEFWFDNDPLRTVLFYSMSGSFPEGERFFIDSVRYYQKQITDPELKMAVRGFIGQEAHHAKEHTALNAFIERRGYPVSKIDRAVGKAMAFFRKHMSPERQLAHTVAIEHFTALFAERLLMENDELSKMDPRMAPIWAWHAVEESEHKAVAFDVYKTVVNNEWIRCSEMVFASLLFITFSSFDFLRLMRHSGHMTDIRMWLRGINYFWGKPGVFRKLIRPYLAFYRRDFHPWQHDSTEMLEYTKRKYLAGLATNS